MWVGITEIQRGILSDFLGYEIPLEVSFNELMPVVLKINKLEKGIQFSIFKTYVSCTSEVGGKFHKDFNFSHAEYVLETQTLIEAILRLSLMFILWYKEQKLVTV
jgi:hypothetical protein